LVIKPTKATATTRRDAKRDPLVSDADAINRIVSAVTSTPRARKLATNYHRDQLVRIF
jgi:hypothetical protein